MFFVVFKSLLLVSVLSLCWFETQFFVAAQLPQSEVDALNQIAKTMGATNLTFNVDTACDTSKIPVKETDSEIKIACTTLNNTSHVIILEFKRLSLRGVLPPELVQLPHLQQIDFAYNYLNGSIPVEWTSMQLKFISVFGNRLSGNIPRHLGKITSLTYLDLEANQFSGTVPAELGKLVNLEQLRLSSNQLSGNLPIELAELKNLTQFRINDNNFSGSIPDFIQNWKQLRRLYIQGSGLKGPIPSSISALESLEQLRIRDVNGTNQAFPDLANLTTLTRIILRNCNISGEIPRYIWEKNKLRIFFLSGNSLSGNIQESILKRGTVVNINLNLFRSSPANNNLSGVLPCKNNLKCERYRHSFYINCGGQNMKVNGSTFEGDGGNDGGAATYYLNDAANWGFSSTGDFTDDNDEQNRRYIADSSSQLLSNLYKNARIAPLSLTYFGYCLANGNYLVTLHFTEIIFTDDNTYNSLGRRIFDIYIQDKLVEKDFNIEAEASGVLKAISKPYNVTVANNILEIRFYWAGKGTTAIPRNGVYGPLVSAISVVDPNFKPGKKSIASIVGGVVAGICIIVLVLGFLCRKYYIRAKSEKQTDLKGLDLQTNSFTLKQIKAATNNFDSQNKIGEGGFDLFSRVC